jgi:hypothetical protein
MSYVLLSKEDNEYVVEKLILLDTYFVILITVGIVILTEFSELLIDNFYFNSSSTLFMIFSILPRYL